MGPKKCQVCDEAQSKYKCPACLIPYCSLLCFKKHKESPCLKPLSPAEAKLNTAPLSDVERPFHVDKPSEVMQQFQFEAIASSSEVRDALKNEELQKLVYNIGCSPDPLNELDKTMNVEVFSIFAEKILSTISR